MVVAMVADMVVATLTKWVVDEMTLDQKSFNLTA